MRTYGISFDFSKKYDIIKEKVNMNSFDYLQCEDVYPESDWDFWMDEED